MILCFSFQISSKPETADHVLRSFRRDRGQRPLKRASGQADATDAAEHGTLQVRGQHGGAVVRDRLQLRRYASCGWETNIFAMLLFSSNVLLEFILCSWSADIQVMKLVLLANYPQSLPSYSLDYSTVNNTRLVGVFHNLFCFMLWSDCMKHEKKSLCIEEFEATIIWFGIASSTLTTARPQFFAE